MTRQSTICARHRRAWPCLPSAMAVALALFAAGCASESNIGGDRPDACTPTACSTSPENCGAVSNGCGGTLDCGDCNADEVCRDHVCVAGCEPKTCDVGNDCGTISDGCNGTLDCAGCTAPETCSGAGIANRCGCTAKTCASQAATCGTISDGCGHDLDCGDCYLPETCGGGGMNNRCGCAPTTCQAAGKNCGTAPDGCGDTLDCGGPCSGSDVCGGNGPNVCGPTACVPTTCASLGRDCGVVSDGCADVLVCGDCRAPAVCAGEGTENLCACPSGTWAMETVDFAGRVGEYSSLALNASGIHIAYHDESLGSVKYAFKGASDAWTIETADSTPASGRYLDSALTSTGDVYVAFQYQGSGVEQLRIARRNPAGLWSTTVFDLGNDQAGVSPSIFVDTSDNAHAVDVNTGKGTLNYASALLGEPWGQTDLTPWEDGTNFWSPRFVVDPQAGGHLLVQSGANAGLEYRYYAPGELPVAREKTVVDPLGGLYNSLKRDAQGGLHVLYRNYRSDRLKYAYRDPASGAWSTEFVEQAGDTGVFHDLALDGQNTVHIVFRDLTLGVLKYAVRTGSSVWSIETVGPDGADYPSLAVDPDGAVHLSYFAEIEEDLRYAYRCP